MLFSRCMPGTGDSRFGTLEAVATPISRAVMLATSMHAQPGVYAVLLGSGVSTGAGLPTGWGIVNQLVERVAAQMSSPGTDHISAAAENPEAWWAKNFDEPLGYSSLLRELAPTGAARQGLLAPFFEATPEEIANGQKAPSRAHHALAALVKRGLVRVIITTNFDRLTEQALSAAGVEPQVISRPDAAAGMRPLAHAPATIIKLHGDYLDVQSLNTDDELAAYADPWKKLLAQVLDEYGLIISGWSADWDAALVQAIEESPGRRYPLYWDRRSSKGATAQRLLSTRQGLVIDAQDADGMFTTLLENVQTLDLLTEPPLTTDMAVARLKRYLPDPVHRIDLYDLVMGMVAPVRDAVQEVGPSVQPSTEPYESAIMTLARETEPLLTVLEHGVFHDDGAHDDLWVRTLQALLDLRGTPGNSHWDATWPVQHLPAQLALYTMSALAIVRHRDDLLLRLANEPTWQYPFNERREWPACIALHGNRVLDHDLVNTLKTWGEDGARWRYPQSQLLRKLLEPVLAKLVAPARIEELLDDVEYRLGLAQWLHLDLPDFEREPHSGLFIGERRWVPNGGPRAEERLRADLQRAATAAAWRPKITGDVSIVLNEFRAVIAGLVARR